MVDGGERAIGNRPKETLAERRKKSQPFDQSLSYQVRITHRLIERYLQSKTQPYGITIGMWYFLRALWDQDGLTQRELSEAVGSVEPTTLQAIKTMETIGLVKRVRSVTDRRMINIHLTTRGQALKEKLLPVAMQVSEGAIAGLSPKERDIFLSLLRAIQANVRARIKAAQRFEPDLDVALDDVK
jgi:MarR family transcriptional regulator, organic hydroperoxide resistance regulator